MKVDPWNDETLAANGRPVRDNFADWFGASKVVNAQGEPLPAYHGTSADIARFKTSKTGLYGAGIYFTGSSSNASDFFDPSNAPAIYPVYLSIQRPYIIGAYDTWADIYLAILGREPFKSDEEHPSLRQAKRLQEELECVGHDGIEVVGADWSDSGASHYIVFHPQQVKSAVGNSGLYQIDSPSLDDGEAARRLELARQARSSMKKGFRALEPQP